MSIQKSTHLSLQEAQEILKPFNCIEGKTINAESEQAIVRQALLLIAEHCDYQILGICAETMTQGLSALKTYSEALGYQSSFGFDSIDGPVYIKFNGNSGLNYIDSYIGEHRGVLVSCQSSDEGRVNEMYGHLPLDLFETGD